PRRRRQGPSSVTFQQGSGTQPPQDKGPPEWNQGARHCRGAGFPACQEVGTTSRCSRQAGKPARTIAYKKRRSPDSFHTARASFAFPCPHGPSPVPSHCCYFTYWKPFASACLRAASMITLSSVPALSARSFLSSCATCCSRAVLSVLIWFWR